MRHIISVLIENESGALSRVAGLFSARGFNIESLTVAATTDDGLSRMTIVSHGDDDIIEQIIKQLNKLIDTVKVVDLTCNKHIERELMLVKVSSDKKYQLEIKQLVDIFSCKIVDVSERTYSIEVAGKSRKIDAFLNALGEIDKTLVLEVARSGITGVARGKKVL
jgi:acetolactate synthase-1/3 small subunit